MPRAATAERMDEYERQIALLLAAAGVRDYAHLHRILQREAPGLIKDASTVWRYLFRPPKRRDYRIVTAIARVLDLDPDRLDDTFSERRVDMRVLFSGRVEARSA